MTIKLFGRVGCARTRRVQLRLSKWMAMMQQSVRVDFRFFDLETAEGLAEAAYEQLEGDLPVLIVETDGPGTVISGEPLLRNRKSYYRGGLDPFSLPSRN